MNKPASFLKSCLIVDDEPNAIRIIETYLHSFPNLRLVGSARHALDALTILQAQKIDLLFLDIQMPRITGFQLLKSLQEPPTVIITSAHRNYALDAFDFQVMDYLLKPVSFERFSKAVGRFFELQFDNEHDEPGNIDPESMLIIRSERRSVRIPFRDILYLEAMGDYVAIYRSGGERHLTLETLTRLADRLPKNEFNRIHRKFVINRRHILATNHHSAFIGDRELPIGPNYRPLI